MSKVIRSHGCIVRDPAFRGGDACIESTGVAVWELARWRKAGCSDADILRAYRQLTAVLLRAAWRYADEFPEEVARQIREAEGEGGAA